MTQSAARRASSRATPARKTPPAPASQTPAPSPGGTAGTALGPTSRRSSGSAAAKDQPLKEDIRFLGRLLGDVLREQEGAAAFETVETIRQTAVRFRRDGDRQAEQELDRLLKTLSRDQTTSVVRAFSYVSHLANLAEDQHHNRRRRVHALAGSSPQPGSLLRA
ncbi:phosphoenolpyruvate carboxylase, partial [Ralstonia pseudosolanacearum]|uniref:phosphoenolpyruvate carboxylase n=1 Tax=Ralstonia pseudosolanacearum TaxID=1310165 RepID=UPI003CF30569